MVTSMSHGLTNMGGSSHSSCIAVLLHAIAPHTFGQDETQTPGCGIGREHDVPSTTLQYILSHNTSSGDGLLDRRLAMSDLAAVTFFAHVTFAFICSDAE